MPPWPCAALSHWPDKVSKFGQKYHAVLLRCARDRRRVGVAPLAVAASAVASPDVTSTLTPASRSCPSRVGSALLSVTKSSTSSKRELHAKVTRRTLEQPG